MTVVPGSNSQEFDFFLLSPPEMKQTFIERIICRISQKTDVETKQASVSSTVKRSSNSNN